MKFLKNVSILALMAFIATTISCGDDDPKEPEIVDEVDPVVTITSPADGSEVSTLDATTSITIEYEVTDNEEITSVVVDFDGTQVAEITDFTDFRVYDGEQVVTDVGDGSHTITITATDVGNNTATATSTFTKTTTVPYTPLDNEIHYLPFEGDYVDMVTEEEATTVGSPGFAGEGKIGDNAYQGAADAYLTIGSTDFQSTMTVMFWLKLDVTADRAGVMALSAEDTENPDAQNNRTKGFRILREASGDLQIFKANYGTGDADVWLDGGDFAKLDPTDGEWHHFALVIDETTAAFYIDGGLVADQAEQLAMDLTGCDALSIMSGAPRFVGWSHFSDGSAMDDLKIFSAALTEEKMEEITGLEFGEAELPPLEDPADPGLDAIDGADATEILYMSFDTDFTIEVATATATEVGTPTVVDGGVSGKAYSGNADSYISIPTAGLLNDEFSASMWIKLDPTATRAGILTISAPGDDNNNRTKGLRLFREGDDYAQTFKLNVGTGEADTWIDGGAYAKFSASREGWLHMAITVGGGKSQVYLNGILAAVSGEDVVVDWTDCDAISFGSGAPNFIGWDHWGETSLLDELRIYNGILNPAQIATLSDAGN